MLEQSLDISTVLVTGATGFIGSRLVSLLGESGFRVRVYSRHCHRFSPQLQIEEESWFRGDLHNQESLAVALNGVDAVFHVAGVAHSNDSSEEEMFRTNSRGTNDVFSAAALAGVKRFVFFSSILASRPQTSAYAASKRSAEDILLAHDYLGTQVVILRSANVYGPGMQGNIATFIRWIRSGFFPSLPRLENTFPLISVQDLCATAIACAIDDLADKQVYVYTVTDGERYTPTRIEAAIHKLAGREPSTFRIPRWLLYVGAKLAHFANNLGVKPNHIGPRLYRNLVDSRFFTDSGNTQSYPLPPTATFESELPAIIHALDQG